MPSDYKIPFMLWTYKVFLKYLPVALDVTANCICEIHCLEQNGFDSNTSHKLNS